MSTLRKIEIAIQRIYAFHSPFRAEQFLTIGIKAVAPVSEGALLVRSGDELELGIYLSPRIQESLVRIPIERGVSDLSACELNSFSIAVEEVSHFHYLIYQAGRGRKVSQLELEIQGEIDRFMICYFSNPNPHSHFDALFDRLFENFAFASHLTPEQIERYQEAHTLAKNFLLKHMRRLASSENRELLFRLLRRFYRLPAGDKFALAAAK